MSETIQIPESELQREIEIKAKLDKQRSFMKTLQGIGVVQLEGRRLEYFNEQKFAKNINQAVNKAIEENLSEDKIREKLLNFIDGQLGLLEKNPEIYSQSAEIINQVINGLNKKV